MLVKFRNGFTKQAEEKNHVKTIDIGKKWFPNDRERDMKPVFRISYKDGSEEVLRRTDIKNPRCYEILSVEEEDYFDYLEKEE